MAEPTGAPPLAPRGKVVIAVGSCLSASCSVPDSEHAAQALVKLDCSNESCPYGGFMHAVCYHAFEEEVLKLMRVTGRARSWSEKVRRNNLWLPKGYNLVKKYCKCRCGIGNLRRDLSWAIPSHPLQEEAGHPGSHGAGPDVAASVAIATASPPRSPPLNRDAGVIGMPRAGSAAGARVTSNPTHVSSLLAPVTTTGWAEEVWGSPKLPQVGSSGAIVAADPGQVSSPPTAVAAAGWSEDVWGSSKPQAGSSAVLPWDTSAGDPAAHGVRRASAELGNGPWPTAVISGLNNNPTAITAVGGTAIVPQHEIGRDEHWSLSDLRGDLT